ncbi:MAG: HAMP domain-containing histidine kinase [SAR202 cluster bacterium]|nr:HAMP domain-containing histidine kinase [SAR202 cluster bacterium]
MPLRSFAKIAGRLLDPRYKRLHVFVITLTLVVHTVMHYATYFPAVAPYVASIPYFRLHVLHEAEFLLIVAYAGVVMGLRAGLVAVVVTGITSIPFILSPRIMPQFYPNPGALRDQVIQVVFVLAMGLMITLLYDRDQRRRNAEHAAATLREVDRVKDNFMSIAAHELRTPLTTLYGFSELLLTRQVQPAQQRKWLESIHDETHRLSTLVDDLLNVSRIESGALTLRKDRLSMAEVVASALRAYGEMPATHALQVDVPETLPEIVGDHDKLVQIIVNLVSNAVKYSPNGGAVVVTARHFAGTVELRVRDQGLGIAPEDQAKLFTTFYRVQRPETKKVPGTGIGLYIVKSLVEIMGGRVWIESEVGKGSMFAFTVPVWTESAALAPEPEDDFAPVKVSA